MDREEKLKAQCQDEAYLQERLRTETEWPEQLYGSLDGAHVRIEDPDEGEKWREMKTGCWYQVEPVPSSQQTQRHHKKEEIGHQALRAKDQQYYCDIQEVDDFEPLFWATGCQAKADLATELIFLGDGAKWIWRLVDTHYPKAVQIVDWHHAEEYLEKVAKDTFPESKKRITWLENTRSALWWGDTSFVIRACASLAPRSEGAICCRMWHEIKPLVEEAWTAPNTSRVIEIAREILATLEIPEGYALPDLSIFQIAVGAGDDIPEERDGKPLPFPVAAFDGASPGQGTDFDDESIPTPNGDDITQPAPYAELEDAATPLARQLVDALKIPQPHIRPLPHEWRGRYSFRQEVRTPAMPHLRRAGVGREKDDIVFYVLVDRSGSMGIIDEPVRLALMTLYLAATELGIPLGMAYFGEYRDGIIDDLVLEVSSVRARAAEETKSLIAGFRGVTGAEFLNWGLALAEKALLPRPERRKVLLVLHDGEPVYKGALGNDYQMSLERLRSLERQGITPIGLYLGEGGNIAQLEALFTRLVITSGERLPEKFGSMLMSLV